MLKNYYYLRYFRSFNKRKLILILTFNSLTSIIIKILLLLPCYFRVIKKATLDIDIIIITNFLLLLLLVVVVFTLILRFNWLTALIKINKNVINLIFSFIFKSHEDALAFDFCFLLSRLQKLTVNWKTFKRKTLNNSNKH